MALEEHRQHDAAGEPVHRPEVAGRHVPEESYARSKPQLPDASADLRELGPAVPQQTRATSATRSRRRAIVWTNMVLVGPRLRQVEGECVEQCVAASRILRGCSESGTW